MHAPHQRQLPHGSEGPTSPPPVAAHTAKQGAHARGAQRPGDTSCCHHHPEPMRPHLAPELSHAMPCRDGQHRLQNAGKRVKVGAEVCKELRVPQPAPPSGLLSPAGREGGEVQQVLAKPGGMAPSAALALQGEWGMTCAPMGDAPRCGSSAKGSSLGAGPGTASHHMSHHAASHHDSVTLCTHGSAFGSKGHPE